jgi:hypothetical protein
VLYYISLVQLRNRKRWGDKAAKDWFPLDRKERSVSACDLQLSV